MIPIGAQLYVFSPVTSEGQMEAALAGLAGAGYSCVETMFDKPPRDPAVFGRVGLSCYATHVALSTLPDGAALEDFAGAMGAKVVCVSGLLRWHERKADDYRRAIKPLNALGARLRERGIALHYHNHGFEFATVEAGETGMDILLAGCDPSVVALCFDAGWAALAGCDPLDFARTNAQRIGTLHLRDFRAGVSVPLGTGDLNVASVAAELLALPRLQAALIEQDPGTPTPDADMAQSRRFLQSVLGD